VGESNVATHIGSIDDSRPCEFFRGGGEAQIEGEPMSEWSSALYLKFERERTRAARDLLIQLPAFDPQIVYDLGCGPGNSTELLARAFPKARIVGIDSSEDMLAAARKRVSRASFVAQRVEEWRPSEKAGLNFANAVLQFVPDHQELMPRLASYLAPGG
jgi:trans-aconitate 2-methyltransferase